MVLPPNGSDNRGVLGALLLTGSDNRGVLGALLLTGSDNRGVLGLYYLQEVTIGEYWGFTTHSK